MADQRQECRAADQTRSTPETLPNLAVHPPPNFTIRRSGLQTIGLVGEAVIYITLPAIHIILHASIARFMAFDALGLVLLLLAVWITRDQ
ncbi:MAG TPA: hypothetical protein VMW34_08690 [Anaerolineales bacterium]|nr:hypothetical protein [Anaerolineales bacterium]